MPIEKDKPTKVIDYEKLSQSEQAKFNKKILSGDIPNFHGDSEKDRITSFLLKQAYLLEATLRKTLNKLFPSNKYVEFKVKGVKFYSDEKSSIPIKKFLDEHEEGYNYFNQTIFDEDNPSQASKDEMNQLTNTKKIGDVLNDKVELNTTPIPDVREELNKTTLLKPKDKEFLMTLADYQRNFGDSEGLKKLGETLGINKDSVRKKRDRIINKTKS